jgi:hypothetical protein
MVCRRLQKINPRWAPSACRFSLREIVRLSITAFSYFNARTMKDHEVSPLYLLFFVANFSFATIL